MQHVEVVFIRFFTHTYFIYNSYIYIIVYCYAELFYFFRMVVFSEPSRVQL